MAPTPTPGEPARAGEIGTTREIGDFT